MKNQLISKAIVLTAFIIAPFAIKAQCSSNAIINHLGGPVKVGYTYQDANGTTCATQQNLTIASTSTLTVPAVNSCSGCHLTITVSEINGTAIIPLQVSASNPTAGFSTAICPGSTGNIKYSATAITID